MPINLETGSETEVEDEGDYTVTFEMTLPESPTREAEGE